MSVNDVSLPNPPYDLPTQNEMASPTGIDSLPNEACIYPRKPSSNPPNQPPPFQLLLSILSTLPTRALPRLAAVSRRFYSAAARLLRDRLSRAAHLPGHRLILECYHPSVAISTPWLYCDHIGTDEPPVSGSAHPEPDLPALARLYSHFRPVDQDDGLPPRRRRRRRPLGSDGSEHQQQQQQPPSHDVHLDESEPFTQLCTVTNVVRVGPSRAGTPAAAAGQPFLGHVNVSDGVIRVWRDWLATAASAAADSEPEEEVLWADAAQDVGLRFRVREIEPTAAERPVLVAADEEAPVSYRLEHRELLVRTRRLLLVMEEEEERRPAMGNALVIIVG
ncbi:F-box domain-containing protein [Phialemonium atrogriseum]|uniref:F-box domain-containing protein n=1 Tax=Phialemonium atrogriseum TaxID=1093897 RepID=A0AAJ0C1E6_9PEZI|nr:F-box domain-containing protein [Phialemonium atrogriseum]KAK1768136.1 F-box domain-containing protein [Phialemonium atrogriseum]